MPEVDEESGVPVKASRWSCSHKGERENATHGCPESGRAPTTWSEAHGGYVDGMGRLDRCGYCASCAGTGWTVLRDPWTDQLVDWWAVPCLYCYAGWLYHSWRCEGHDDAHKRKPRTVEHWGVTFDGRTFLPGEVVAPNPALCMSTNHTDGSGA